MDGSKHKISDPWFQHDSPSEFPLPKVASQIAFSRDMERFDGGRAMGQCGQEVLVMAHNVVIPGYATKTTNDPRLWEKKPKCGG